MSNKKSLIGWRGVGPNAGKFVPAEDGFEYVCHHFGIEEFDRTALDAEEFKEMVVEWYFSGNWVEVHETANISGEAMAALNRMGAKAHGGANNG